MADQLDNVQMYQACLAYNRADRVLRNLIGTQLEQFNVSLTEWLLLGVVNQSAKTGITLSEIAASLDVSQPQVTALMDRVVSQRLVRQKVHKHDRRSRTAVLTIKGKRLLDEVEASIRGFMKTWLSEVPADQLEAHAKLTQRIASYKTSEEPTEA